MIWEASFGCGPMISGVFSLMMKDFSKAILAIESPRNSWWSKLIGVMMVADFCSMMLVMSARAPMPDSRIKMSDLERENAKKAATVKPSKNESGVSAAAMRVSSRIW